jgi:hypothetical protein
MYAARMNLFKLLRAGDVVRGMVAGAVGTIAMDTVWYGRYLRSGGTRPPLDWEFSAGIDGWDKVSAPGRMGRLIVESVTGRELPGERAALTQNVMHWAYGILWGGVFGLLAGSSGRPGAVQGVVLGSLVWGSSYVTLPLAGIYKPIWEYDSGTLGQDLTAHLAYGTGTAAAFRFLGGR